MFLLTWTVLSKGLMSFVYFRNFKSFQLIYWKLNEMKIDPYIPKVTKYIKYAHLVIIFKVGNLTVSD